MNNTAYPLLVEYQKNTMWWHRAVQVFGGNPREPSIISSVLPIEPMGAPNSVDLYLCMFFSLVINCCKQLFCLHLVQVILISSLVIVNPS